MKAIGILLLAGKSERTGGRIPKQYVPSKKGTPLFLASYKKLKGAGLCDRFLFVVPKGDVQKVQTILENNRIEGENLVVEGGQNREESVFFALEEIVKNPANLHSIALIHDADRPYLEEDFLKRIKLKMEEGVAFVPVLSSVDSLLVEEGESIRYLPRERIYRVQTPQVFPLGELWNAFQKEREKLGSYRDEGSLYLSVYKKGLGSIEGSGKNIKITNPMELDDWRNSDE